LDDVDVDEEEEDSASHELDEEGHFSRGRAEGTPGPD